MRDRGEDPVPAAADAEAPRWAVPGVDAIGDDTAVQRPVTVTSGDEARNSILAGLRCTPIEPGWADGGKTNLENLALACWPHHRRCLS